MSARSQVTDVNSVLSATDRVLLQEEASLALGKWIFANYPEISSLDGTTFCYLCVKVSQADRCCSVACISHWWGVLGQVVSTASMFLPAFL